MFRRDLEDARDDDVSIIWMMKYRVGKGSELSLYIYKSMGSSTIPPFFDDTFFPTMTSHPYLLPLWYTIPVSSSPSRFQLFSV